MSAANERVETPVVGCIGLGVMGRPMAHNLIGAGYDVVVCNRSQQVVEELVDAGARRAGTPAEVLAQCSVVITCLPDSPDVEQVAYASGGLLESPRRGALWIDMSTIAPESSRSLAARCAEAGMRMLDAPVSGGEQGAVDGTLSVMVGGERDDFEEALPILEVLGSTVILVGPAGSGQTVKAANQLLVAGNIQLVSEAVVLLEACGVEMGPAIEVLAGGLAGSAILDRKAAGMLARDFAPGFRVDLHHKDLGITLATAREKGVAVPAAALVAQLLTSLRATGRGSLDHTALLALAEELSGRGVASSAD